MIVQFASILLLSLLVNATSGQAYSVEENLAYIDKILGYLNNNYQCTLPTYNEVDEMQKCFQELEQAWGSEFESRLNDDHKLVRKTILLYWDSFQKHMTSPVIIRSAKKRTFLCKIEDYQEAKFGDSVCTRIKDIKGPITNHIFEKNPVVRYIKHIQTGEVIERPVEPEIVIEPTTTTTTTTTTPTPTTTITTFTTTTTTTEAPTSVMPETPIPSKEDISEFEVATTPLPEEAPQSAGEIGLPRDDKEPEGVQHTYIGKFTIDYSKLPDKVVVEFERQKNNDNERDPLDDIPVPSSDDKSQRTDINSEISDEDITTTTMLPMFDEFGAEYIEEEYDNSDLERLVRVPKRDWQFDPIYGYFKWPDECDPQMCSINQQPDDSMLTLDGVWYQFLADPYAYDAYLESIKPISTTTPRPKINAALLRQRKNLFDQSVVDDSRRGQIFGWNDERTPKKIELFMPEIKRDRWRNLADNTFCKISYNRDYLKNKGKKSYKAVKNLFGSAEQDSIGFRENLLASSISIAS